MLNRRCFYSNNPRIYQESGIDIGMKRFIEYVDQQKKWYHCSPQLFDNFQKTNKQGAFGKGVYLSEYAEDAMTWIRSSGYVYECNVFGHLLPLVLSNDEIGRFSKYINISRYLNSPDSDSYGTPSMILYMSLERKYGEQLREVLNKIGYVGVLHTSPRNKAIENAVVYNESSITIKKKYPVNRF